MTCRLLVPFLIACPVLGQPPDFYGSVDRIVWVVEDIDRTVEGWRKLGFTDIVDKGEVDLEVQFRTKPASAAMRVVSGRFGDVPVHWIHPLGGANAYTEFLKKHGDGIFSLVHRTPTLQAYQEEIGRLKALGVDVLQSGTVKSDAGPISYTFMDTEPEGKYVLGLLHVPGPIGQPHLAVPGGNASGRRVAQYAFVARELEPVSAFWAKLGWPEMSYTHPQMRDLRYRGQPGQFDMRLGWQRHGKVVYEWILPLKGPEVYSDHLERHGEGVHHLAFQVEDMDREIAEWQAKGFPLGMAGAWGEKDKPGSGRFAYMDTHSIGGLDVELLWDYR